MKLQNGGLFIPNERKKRTTTHKTNNKRTESWQQRLWLHHHHHHPVVPRRVTHNTNTITITTTHTNNTTHQRLDPMKYPSSIRRIVSRTWNRCWTRYNTWKTFPMQSLVAYWLKYSNTSQNWCKCRRERRLVPPGWHHSLVESKRRVSSRLPPIQRWMIHRIRFRIRWIINRCLTVGMWRGWNRCIISLILVCPRWETYVFIFVLFCDLMMMNMIAQFAFLAPSILYFSCPFAAVAVDGRKSSAQLC